jgi:hypothetical protein
LPGGFSAAHFGQMFVSRAPQSPQNVLLAAFSLAQMQPRLPPGDAIVFIYH